MCLELFMDFYFAWNDIAFFASDIFSKRKEELRKAK